MAGCSGSSARSVVVYTSQDQVYSEPILRRFTEQTGIEVRAVYDNEAVKTVGLANRLLAERGYPQCDIWWSNEELRTRQLNNLGVFRETDAWRAVGFRSRRMVINTNHLPRASAPTRLSELTDSRWRGKIALAYPLFGTTAAHFLALRQSWGEARWTEWCRALQSNKPLLVDGNSVVVRLVGKGEAWLGLTDSDDIAAGRREGLPIESMPVTDETLLIPNTVGVIRNPPHAEAAQKLFEYLQQSEVLDRLVKANALEGRTSTETGTATLKPDWGELVRDLELATTRLKEIFLR
ncbi:MAG: substrate-binding domain-containing protein [Verrucomicrobia bacterium]|nr:substrate-binding domain-containing protein [Verrucomicrobiota bacterium]